MRKRRHCSFHQTLQGRPDYAYCLRMKKEAETMQRKRKIGDLEVGLYEAVISLQQLSIVQIRKYIILFVYFGQCCGSVTFLYGRIRSFRISD
jgi:hypothetical protein